jgi:hypothetical protein
VVEEDFVVASAQASEVGDVEEEEVVVEEEDVDQEVERKETRNGFRLPSLAVL